MIKPMLMHEAQPDILDELDPEVWVMEPKFDGVRWQVETADDGVRSWIGRNGSPAALGPKLTAVMERLPPGTVLDAELVGSRVAGSDQQTLAVFDVLVVYGDPIMDRPYESRRAVLEVLAELFGDGVVLVPQFDPQRVLYDQYVAHGGEGMVVKRRDSRYRQDVRTRDWLKVKRAETCEAIVTGWQAGEGAIQGQSGALLVRLLDNDAETSVKYVTTPAAAEAKTGHVMEIKHNGLFPSGSPRHPRFLRWREDRDELASAGQTNDDQEVTMSKTQTEIKPTRTRNVAPGAWIRNYGAMGDQKLLDAIADLERGYGPAVDRVLDKLGDTTVNLARALEVAQARGLR